MSRVGHFLHRTWRFIRVRVRRRFARHARAWTPRRLARLTRAAAYVAAAGLALLAIALSAARLALPSIVERHAELEAYLSRQIGYPVRIERLSTYWDGWHPGLRLGGVALYASDRVDSPPALRLDELRLSVAILPLLWGELEIHSLVLSAPRLGLVRRADGRWQIRGFAPLPLAAASAPDGVERFWHWLFRQGRLAVEDGELEWYDEREPQAALRLTNVNLTLRNRGTRHRFGFTAHFPPALCTSCQLAADIQGNPLLGEAWEGQVYLKAQGVDVGALPRVLREWLPAGFAGRFDLELWSDWTDARPQQVYGEAQVAALRLRLPAVAGERELKVHAAQAELQWRRAGGGGEGWRLDLRRLRLGLSGPVWQAGSLRLVYGPQALTLRARYLDLDDISHFLLSAAPAAAAVAPAGAEPWLKRGLDQLAALAPGGGLRDFKLDINGPLEAPRDWQLEAVLEELRLRPSSSWPGIEGLSGRLRLTQAGGELVLLTRATRLAMPAVFREPLLLGELQGAHVWSRADGYWLFSAKDLALRGPVLEAKGRGMLRWPDDLGQSPLLKLEIEFPRGNVAQARRYFPAGLLRPNVLAWMERSFLDGIVSEGQLVLEGPLRAFPFRGGEGRFELRARVHDGVYGYLPGWEPVRDVVAEVRMRGEELLVTGRGRIGALAASDVVVRYHRDEQGRRLVDVTGLIDGEVSEALRILRAAEAGAGQGGWLSFLPRELNASGHGRLGLEVAVEIRPPDEDDIVRYAAEYQVRNAALWLTGTPLRVEALQGRVRFDENTVREGRFAGRFFGGEVSLAILAEGPKAIVARAAGRIEAQALVRAYLNAPLSARIEGEAPWRAEWRWPPGGRALAFEAEVALSGIRTRLPPPLDYPKGLPVEKLVLRTEPSAPGATKVLTLTAGKLLAGRFVLAHAPVWRFVEGLLLLGETSQPRPAGAEAAAAGPGIADRGLTVRLALERFEADPWLELLGGEEEPRSTPRVLVRLEARIRSLRLFEREFGTLQLALGRVKDNWRGRIEGTMLSGVVLYWPAHGGQGAGRFELDLARLQVPEVSRSAAPSRRPFQTDPRRLPAVALFVRSFQAKGRELGELDFLASPEPDGWRIERLNLVHPQLRFEATGHWRQTAAGPRSEFQWHLTSPNLGAALAALGIPDQVRETEADIRSVLAWPGAPLDIHYAGLDGWIELKAEKGRFLKLDPGAGRFLGMLDLSAIVRYLTFDFSPLFGKGFVFDKLSGRLSIEKGDVSSRDFVIKGPSATIGVVGRVGLASEDFDLLIEVRPQLSDTLTIATWGLFGPQVAAAVFALQKLFKKQIGESTRVVYMVKGPWDEPRIERLVKQNGKEKRVEEPAAGEDAAGQ
jgi:uncharacterized protein (TIGR02099 family)